MKALEVFPEIPTTPFSQTTTLTPARNADPLHKIFTSDLTKDER
jgi:hypothetical protein